MTAPELRNQIQEAFPATQFYGPITSCDCEECMSIRDELRNKWWDELPTAFLNETCSPMLLTAEAFKSFLPAYLLHALDDLDSHQSVVVEFTVYSLCPANTEEDGQSAHVIDDQTTGSRVRQRAGLMSPLQIQAIRAFLAFVQENAADSDWFRPFIADALERIWRRPN